MEERLIEKYNVAGPRYTSYPTVPYWDQKNYGPENWQHAVNQAYWASGREISLYIHLPFCESLCTYCACTTRITKNHEVEQQYMQAVLKEWQMYLDLMPAKPVLKDLHLGGGTPTFFSPANLEKLISTILDSCTLATDYELGFEGHPNNTTIAHLQIMADLGFRRVSFGIQDFDLQVQKLINRIQPLENVMRVTEQARTLGYGSVNYDLVYGLPGQTRKSIVETVNRTIALGPDRVAMYGYAHVPGMKPAQKIFEKLLPDARERTAFYQYGKSRFSQAGYRDIGMDHFARETDSMAMAAASGTLHRNFMGYSTQSTTLQLGLGVSAISDTWTAFSQNHKRLEDYYSDVNEKNILPLSRGHILTEKDLLIRKHILNLMCTYQTTWLEQELEIFGLEMNFRLLDEMEKDKLIKINAGGITVTEKGKPFIRNVCMALDLKLNTREKKAFSKTL